VLLWLQAEAKPASEKSIFYLEGRQGSKESECVSESYNIVKDFQV